MLGEIQKWIAENRAEYVTDFDDSLNPPATAEALDSLEAAIGVSMPDEFRATYLMANGMKRHTKFSVWRLMSVEEIQKYHRLMIGQAVFDELVIEYCWRPFWVPFAVDLTGDWAGINLTPESAQRDEQPQCFCMDDVFVYRQAENCLLGLANSFEQWGETWIEEMVEYAS